MYERVMKDVQEAQQQAQAIVSQAGLTVLHGEPPTEDQVGLATLHAREDAAMSIALLVKVLQRLDEKQVGPPQFYRLGVVCYWAGVIFALPTFGLATIFLFWPLSYVLTGSYWKAPRRLPA